MIGLLGSAIQMSAPSPLTRLRSYEAFLRGPALAVTDRFGTIDAYRQGAQYLKGMVVFPEPSDAYKSDDFGIQESGEVTVQLAGLALADEDATYARLFTLMDTWRNELVDLDLVTRIAREDGTKVEIVNERRGLVKSTSRRQNVLALQVADVDRSALDALIPSKLYTVADFPKLFVDHVNMPVAQGTGTLPKIPLAYVDNTPGAYRYSVCEVIGTAPQLLTLYRDGRIVTASEYSVDATTVAGTTYLRVTFVKEQRDFNLALYKLEADILAPGARAASEEIRRVLLLLGAAVDAASFDSAQAYCVINGMLIDAAYVQQRKGIGIIEDLLQVARGQLYKTPAGAYGIFIDRPRDVRLALSDQTDECEVTDYGKPELTKTLTLEYQPSTSQTEKYAGKLSRTTNGAVGEKNFKNPYMRDDEVADRWLCYMQRKENARSEAHAKVHGVQLAAGGLVAISSMVTWNGWKNFAAPQISRPADANQITLTEYDETVYTYSAGTLPDDATNGYQPDYSQTPPLAPTGLSVVSQGTGLDNNGIPRAYALIRVASPPVTNWARIQALITDSTTSEIYQAQLLLVAGNYEATIGGLRPNRTHSVVAWAVNATNEDGAVTAAVNFTSANYAGAPSAPTGVAVVQAANVRAARLTFTKVTVDGLKGYRVFRKVGAGSYAEFRQLDSNQFEDTDIAFGTAYAYKVRTVVQPDNESADSSEVNITVAKNLSDADILAQGVGGGSIANGSINQGRGYTGTASASGTVSNGFDVGINTGKYAFFPCMSCTALLHILSIGSAGTTDDGQFVMRNDSGASQTYTAIWRNFLA